MMLQVQSYAAHTVAAAADMPLTAAVHPAQVVEAVELAAQEPSAQAHKGRGQMLVVTEETRLSKAHHGLAELMVIR